MEILAGEEGEEQAKTEEDPAPAPIDRGRPAE